MGARQDEDQHGADEDKDRRHFEERMKQILRVMEDLESEAAGQVVDRQFLRGHRGHDFVLVEPEQVADQDHPVSPFFQVVEDRGQRGHRRAPVPSAVVEQDDVAAGKLGFHAFDELVLFRFLPVPGIDIFKDRHVAEGLGDLNGQKLPEICRTGVGVVRRPEKRRGPSGQGLDQSFRGIEFELDECRRSFGEVGMRERVVSDLVTFRNDPPNELRVALGFASDHKERGFHSPGFEDVENRRCPLRVRSIVKCQGDLIRLTGPNPEKRRIRGKNFVLAGDLAMRTRGKNAPAICRGGIEADDFPGADRGDRIPARYRSVGLERLPLQIGPDDAPHAGILHSQPIHSHPAEPVVPDGVQLIGKRGSIEEPDIMAFSFIIIGEASIECRLRCL